MKNKVINIIFIALILTALVAGIVRALFFPKDINELENRYAEKFIPFSASAAIKGDFQDSAEKTLADQVPYAEKMKEFYNGMNSAFIKKCLAFFTDTQERYIKLGDKNIYCDYLVFNPTEFTNIKGALDKRISAYNKMFE